MHRGRLALRMPNVNKTFGDTNGALTFNSEKDYNRAFLISGVPSGRSARSGRLYRTLDTKLIPGGIKRFRSAQVRFSLPSSRVVYRLGIG